MLKVPLGKEWMCEVQVGRFVVNGILGGALSDGVTEMRFCLGLGLQDFLGASRPLVATCLATNGQVLKTECKITASVYHCFRKLLRIRVRI